MSLRRYNFSSPSPGDNELGGNDYTALINFPRPFSRLRSRSTIIGPCIPEPVESQRAAIAFACLSAKRFQRALGGFVARQSAKFLFNDSLEPSHRKREKRKEKKKTGIEGRESRVITKCRTMGTKSTSPIEFRSISCFI